MVCDGTGGRRLLLRKDANKLRQKALRARRNMTVKHARSFANNLQKAHSFANFSSAKLIACYLPMRDEVDTRIIIERAWRANKRIFVPIVRRQGRNVFREIRPEYDLTRNEWRFGNQHAAKLFRHANCNWSLRQPSHSITTRHRIGMGGGYYDRCFSFLRHRKNWLKPKLLGVAFHCQKVEKITPNTWDIRLYRIFSESN